MNEPADIDTFIAAWRDTGGSELANTQSFINDLCRLLGVDAPAGNRIFSSHDNIIDLCCEAWNRLVDQPWRIMTIGRRKWARGS